MGAQGFSWRPRSQFTLSASPVMSTAPSEADIAAKKDGLKTAETKTGDGKADPAVVKIYEGAWDEHGGDKAKICAALGLVESKWDEVTDMTKEKFLAKFLG